MSYSLMGRGLTREEAVDLLLSLRPLDEVQWRITTRWSAVGTYSPAGMVAGTAVTVTVAPLSARAGAAATAAG